MAKEIKNLTVDELFEFVSTTLGMPDVAEKFKEQDIDGETIPQLTTSIIREYIPTLSLGKCLQFFRKLEKHSKLNTVEAPKDNSPTSINTNEAYTVESTKDNSPTSIITNEASESLPSPSITYPPSSRKHDVESSSPGDFSRPSEKESLFMKSSVSNFPVEKLVIPPDGKKMIETGKPSIAGKSAITTSVVTLLLELSPSSCYVSFEWKKKAAVALLEKYPTLKFGMGLKESQDAWHQMLSNKLVNWRKRGKLVSAETEAKKLKYSKQASSGSRVVITADIRKSKVLPIPLFAPDNSLQMEDDQNELLNKLSKPQRNRNKKLIRKLSKSTYPLRRQLTTKSDIHTSKLLAEWPSMKLDYVLLDELTLISSSAYKFSLFEANLLDCYEGIINISQSKLKNYSTQHPLHKLHQCLEGNDKNQDLMCAAIVCSLCYILPSNSKKKLFAHQYLIDLVVGNSTELEVNQAASDRCQPFLIAYGKLLGKYQ